MSIKSPPNPLARPNYLKLRKGTVIHRVHLSVFDGDSFNPCDGGQTRFAPIADAKGKCVPSLYAGSTVESAIFETIFHDIPVKAELKTVPKIMVTERSHSELKLTRGFELVMLHAADLSKWKIRRQNLIGSSPKLYGKTAEWATAIHHQFLNADGLVWTSNLCDPAVAYLFFGDRVQSEDFEITQTRPGKTDKTFLRDVRKAGQRADIKITL